MENLEFSYYEPTAITYYSLFLIAVYIILFINILRKVRKDKNTYTIMFLILSIISVIFSVVYEVGAQMFANSSESIEVFPEVPLSFGFLTIFFPAFIFLIFAYIFTKEK